MAWLYDQSTGRMLFPNGTATLATGYSGAPGAVNNPVMQDVVDIGPIPEGAWAMGEPYDAADTGPFTIPLTPSISTTTFGRDGFKIHGDSIEFAGEQRASEGCIILPRWARERLWESSDHNLHVVGSVAASSVTRVV